MKKLTKVLASAIAMLYILTPVGCKEESEPSNIPSIPTELNLEDGAVIEETEITLSASGSIVENENYNLRYRIYCGTSVDNMQEFNVDSEIELQPYTQYFWCAKGVAWSGDVKEYSEASDIRTFYCVPPVEVETDNGDGNWAAVVRFKGLKDVIKKGKVAITPDKKGYPYQAELELAEGQDSCYLQLGNSHNPTNAAYTHWWDDEKNIFYEPIIYDFDISLDLKVGDKIFTVTNKAREIILDKSSCARDIDFNVYRLIKIGNQTWMAEDFRAKSVVYNGKTYSLDDIDYWDKKYTPYRIVTLNSGAQGVIYFYKPYFSSSSKFGDGTGIDARYIMEGAVPKGFHIPTFEDWAELESFYGVSNPELLYDTDIYPYDYMNPYKHDYYLRIGLYDDFVGNETNIRAKMSLNNDDWIGLDEEDKEYEGYQSLFNAKPFVGEGYGCTYMTKVSDEDYYSFVVLSSYSKGIANPYGKLSYLDTQTTYTSIRLIKD
ncbi:MAG: fibrobacter succinogenes major paralogous domain-containing protein [Bacteroidales bacterium]|nr:fibrobacter succinogenes major paralogous domain-containing protein [Bacteroidales bacterium]